MRMYLGMYIILLIKLPHVRYSNKNVNSPLTDLMRNNGVTSATSLRRFCNKLKSKLKQGKEVIIIKNNNCYMNACSFLKNDHAILKI